MTPFKFIIYIYIICSNIFQLDASKYPQCYLSLPVFLPFLISPTLFDLSAPVYPLHLHNNIFYFPFLGRVFPFLQFIT